MKKKKENSDILRISWTHYIYTHARDTPHANRQKFIRQQGEQQAGKKHSFTVRKENEEMNESISKWSKCTPMCKPKISLFVADFFKVHLRLKHCVKVHPINTEFSSWWEVLQPFCFCVAILFGIRRWIRHFVKKSLGSRCHFFVAFSFSFRFFVFLLLTFHTYVFSAPFFLGGQGDKLFWFGGIGW